MQVLDEGKLKGRVRSRLIFLAVARAQSFEFVTIRSQMGGVGAILAAPFSFPEPEYHKMMTFRNTSFAILFLVCIPT
jgi:hypothetical protein